MCLEIAEEKHEESEDDVGFEKYETKAQKKKKKKKKKKDEEEDTKTVSNDDRLKEMTGEDAFNQVKEMLATFKADILSDYKEGLREASEQIEQARLSRELLT